MIILQIQYQKAQSLLVKGNIAQNSYGMVLKMGIHMGMGLIATHGILIFVQVRNHLPRKTGIMQQQSSVIILSIGVLTIDWL